MLKLFTAAIAAFFLVACGGGDPPTKLEEAKALLAQVMPQQTTREAADGLVIIQCSLSTPDREKALCSSWQYSDSGLELRVWRDPLGIQDDLYEVWPSGGVPVQGGWGSIGNPAGTSVAIGLGYAGPDIPSYGATFFTFDNGATGFYDSRGLLQSYSGMGTYNATIGRYTYRIDRWMKVSGG
jgi:hypothetical protein